MQFLYQIRAECISFCVAKYGQIVQSSVPALCWVQVSCLLWGQSRVSWFCRSTDFVGEGRYMGMTYLGTLSCVTLLWGVHLDHWSDQWCRLCLWSWPHNPHFVQWGCMCPWGIQHGPCLVSPGQSKVTLCMTVLLPVLAVISCNFA